MSQQCHFCGPVKHEAPTVLCAPCALQFERSDLARRRLEAFIPLADFIRDTERAFKPAIYIPPLGLNWNLRR